MLMNQSTELNNYINSIVNSDKFTNAVRRASVTLNDRGSITDEVIKETAIYDSFPRIILRIATAKNKEGVPIFKGIGYGNDYSDQEREVYRVISQQPFSSGLVRVASSLTAAKLIRSIPLNTDLRFLDSSKFIEEQAISDLDSLIGILTDNPELVETLIKETQSSSFFFSQELDLATIPPLAFDKVTGMVAILDSARLHSSVQIPANSLAEIHISISSAEDIKELRLPIKNGEDISDIVSKIANTINEALIYLNANLIASVTINNPIKTSLKYSKRELYGDVPNNSKELMLTLYPAIHRIQIAAKSPTVDTEKQLISISAINRTLDNVVIGGITGLVYGTTSNYKNLTPRGPHSLLIDTTRVPVKESSSLSKIDSLDIDSFHFRLRDGYTSVRPGRINIRISNLPDSSYPTEWAVDIPDTQPHIIANLIHDSFYQRRISNQVVTSMGALNTLQIIAFVLCPKEIKIVVDLLNIPEGLEVATGSLTQVLTPYNQYSRSVTVKSQLDYVNYGRNTASNSKDPSGIGGIVPPKHSPIFLHLQNRLAKLSNCSIRPNT